MAVDNHQDKIDRISDKISYAVCLDSTDSTGLKSLGLQDMDIVVVAIGEGFESSMLTTAMLQEIGVKRIMNRVISPIHEKILKQMGVEELLVPEADSAAHLANRLMMPGLIEFFDIGNGFGIYEITAPEYFIGKNLIEINLRKDYKLNLVTIKRQSGNKALLKFANTLGINIIGVPEPDTVIQKDDVMVLFGKNKDVQNLLGE